MKTRAGVLAVQGDVPEHVRALHRAFGPHIQTVAIRSADDIADCAVLVIPGGESTTISRLIDEYRLAEPIREHAAAGKPVLATCAGLIVAARNTQDPRVESLDLLDVTIDRNAFGRQRDSFEASIEIDGLADPFPGVFIRAPRIDAVGDVETLAHYAGEPVAVRQGPVVGASFHPELTDDPRFHRLAVPALPTDP